MTPLSKRMKKAFKWTVGERIYESSARKKNYFVTLFLTLRFHRNGNAKDLEKISILQHKLRENWLSKPPLPELEPNSPLKYYENSQNEEKNK